MGGMWHTRRDILQNFGWIGTEFGFSVRKLLKIAGILNFRKDLKNYLEKDFNIKALIIKLYPSNSD